MELISKYQSVELKGVAILFMLAYHLVDMVIDKSASLITIAHEPLFYYIHNATHPVPFFLILSGYGLAYNYHNGKRGFIYIFRRIVKLYMLFWSVLMIFPVILGQIFAAGHFNFSMTHIVANFTGWYWSWNNHTWFLFPYVLLSLMSVALFKLNERFKPELIAVATFVLSFLCAFLISRYGDVISKSYLVYHPILVVECMFPFQLGALLYVRRECLGRMLKKMTSIEALVALCALFLVKSIFKTHAFNSVYAFAIIMLFLNVKLSVIVKRILAFLGKYSTGIWFIHGFVGVHIFKNEINQMHSPFLIFLVVATVSLLCSFVLTNTVKCAYDKWIVKSC